jgi:hypothetical protein
MPDDWQIEALVEGARPAFRGADRGGWLKGYCSWW